MATHEGERRREASTAMIIALARSIARCGDTHTFTRMICTIMKRVSPWHLGMFRRRRRSSTGLQWIYLVVVGQYLNWKTRMICVCKTRTPVVLNDRWVNYRPTLRATLPIPTCTIDTHVHQPSTSSGLVNHLSRSLRPHAQLVGVPQQGRCCRVVAKVSRREQRYRQNSNVAAVTTRPRRGMADSTTA